MVVIKTVLVEVYTRFSTTLVDPDRTQKRPWEGADRMAEVKFTNVFSREGGERPEKGGGNPSNLPKESDRHPQEEPFRTQPNSHGALSSLSSQEPLSKDSTDDAKSFWSQKSNIPHNTLTLSCNINTLESPSLHRPPLMNGNAIDSYAVQSSKDFPDNEIASQASSLTSLIPPSLPLSSDPPEQECDEQTERVRPVPPCLPMSVDSAAQLDEYRTSSKAKGPVGRLRRPVLMQRSTAPERVDGVLQGS